MDIVIEKPNINHAGAIATICSTGWKQTVEGILSDEYQLINVAYWYNEERVKSDIEAGAYSYIALMDSQVVGVIGGGKTGTNTGEIFVLYVDDQVKYNGIGKKLLETLTQEQIEEGISEQWVSVQEGNYRGIPFYEARGFTYKEKRIQETETGEQQVSLRYSREIPF
ncbi:GNAT family N-acetyltransferase [Alkalibacillus salilacus]|uniref:Ribosomal protein S18 acetylase RimI-like enzyme n=1 Tax=Alkalibacillus salilacus TaxID=284582 RepID=A0ABT9VG71_9BACI|nr:GNAT family N-acetyltransferase [Alkalibacillus salilacus]MDQ0159959.1 ribosomal protein S18 acetylase RimI-like enzyme [Alkalibacillus salilacus]